MARAIVDVDLRWGDQDAYGHVNNVAFARLLEEARVRLFWLGASRVPTGMEQHFRADDPDGPKMLVASQQIEFTRVLEYTVAPVNIEVWIGALGGSSLEVHYEVVDGSVAERSVVARAVTHVVVVDGTTMRPMRLTGAARASVAAWVDAPLVFRRGSGSAAG